MMAAAMPGPVKAALRASLRDRFAGLDRPSSVPLT